jgi:hypothetical protein
MGMRYSRMRFPKLSQSNEIIAVWAKVGAAPLTRACLLDSKAAHQVVTDTNGVIDVYANPLTTILLALGEANHRVCDHLSAQECDGDQLRNFAPRVLAKKPVYVAIQSRASGCNPGGCNCWKAFPCHRWQYLG